MKKKACVICILVIIALPYLYPLFSPWSRINSTECDIDIDSGRLRVTSYFYWIKTSTDYRHTPISSEIYHGDTDTPDGDWLSVSSFGVYTNHSPHYPYHSASNQASQLKLIWAELGSDSNSREEHSRHILSLWKKSGNDRDVDAYIASLLSEP